MLTVRKQRNYWAMATSGSPNWLLSFVRMRLTDENLNIFREMQLV